MIMNSMRNMYLNSVALTYFMANKSVQTNVINQ